MSSEETWQKRIEQHSRSGVSIAQWCNRQGLPAHQFYYWRKRLSGTDIVEGRENFVRVGVSSSEPVELLIGEQFLIEGSGKF